LSARILLYQFLQPAIGGKGQFLKASCHREGSVKAALKGILWDSAAMIRNSNRTKEIRRRIGLSANQKLSGKLLLEEGGKEISGKNRKVECRMKLIKEEFT
jgi:hypothetical protein